MIRFRALCDLRGLLGCPSGANDVPEPGITESDPLPEPGLVKGSITRASNFCGIPPTGTGLSLSPISFIVKLL